MVPKGAGVVLKLLVKLPTLSRPSLKLKPVVVTLGGANVTGLGMYGVGAYEGVG